MSAAPGGPAARLRRYRGAGAGAVRLLCLPHAGGSASYFFGLSRRLAPAVRTLAVQYPGRQDRRTEPPAGSVAELADGVVAALAAQADDDRAGPLVLFGHSLGAIVAFEAARRLEGAGGTGPAALILSGRRAPSRSAPETLHLRDDAGVLAELQQLGGTEERVLGDEDLVKMILPAGRADYRALAAYVGEWEQAAWQPVGCPIGVMVGDSDPVAPVPDALAWERFTTGGVAVEGLPGGHFYLSGDAEPVVESIRRVLKTYA